MQLTDKTEPVIDKPDPSIISVTAEGSSTSDGAGKGASEDGPTDPVARLR